jgi:hypothetical protein
MCNFYIFIIQKIKKKNNYFLLINLGIVLIFNIYY